MDYCRIAIVWLIYGRFWQFYVSQRVSQRSCWFSNDLYFMKNDQPTWIGNCQYRMTGDEIIPPTTYYLLEIYTTTKDTQPHTKDMIKKNRHARCSYFGSICLLKLNISLPHQTSADDPGNVFNDTTLPWNTHRQLIIDQRLIVSMHTLQWDRLLLYSWCITYERWSLL